ncbi:MAG TPA: YqiA/YcfP family alpha/beta fold hydrolase [Planctomycetota bacterium]|nr:YqiA/YcfP family alpha/beta fold hydrolase [Planctomycetota bacterium]
MAPPRIVYLHGFASGPGSVKARDFRRRFAERGIDLAIPDLNEPGGFEGLTLTRMLGVVRPLAPEVLIGSSLGGYTAALLAAREPSVRAVVLMAPAFDFPRRIAPVLGPDSPLVRDGLAYEAFPDVRCPALVLHGVRDETVPVELSREFGKSRKNVTLVELDDDHLLHASMERMWAETLAFLGRVGVVAIG